MIVIYGTLVENNICRLFFHFFKILIFFIVRWIKGQKAVQNRRKFYSSRFIFREPCIIWLSLTHGRLVQNDNIPRYFFYFLKILSFWVVKGVKRQKAVQNRKKFYSSRFIFQEPYIIWLSFIDDTIA